MNFVYGASFGTNNSNVDYAGKTPTAAVCSALCRADPGCDAFTWHDADQPAGETQWEEMCYFVNKGRPHASRAQAHHTSGAKVRLDVYVARGSLTSPAAL